MRRVSVVVAGLLALTACGGGEPIDQELNQTLWELATITDADIPSEPAASVAFAEGEIGGTTGCNTIGGSYRVIPNEDSISIGPLRSTLAACATEELAARERAMMATLQAAARYQITADGLHFLAGNGDVLSTYTTLVPDLAGTSWTLIGYNTGTQSVRTVVNGTKISIEFHRDGSFEGNSGCNTFGGTYEVSGDYTVVGGQSLAVSDLAGTEIACLEPDGVMEQESQFLTALANSGLWRLIGTNMELRAVDGSLQISAIPSN